MSGSARVGLAPIRRYWEAGSQRRDERLCFREQPLRGARVAPQRCPILRAGRGHYSIAVVGVVYSVTTLCGKPMAVCETSIALWGESDREAFTHGLSSMPPVLSRLIRVEPLKQDVGFFLW
jgi:hypothetical protein